VFGIAITHLTSLLARRSVYCSKHAQGKHSIAKSFSSDAGNIWFERLEHMWVDGRCAVLRRRRRFLTGARSLKATPTHSFTPMTSRLG
jgi:hypothetical protein